MMRPFYVVATNCVLLLSQISAAHAAGPYDGEWNGSATSTTARCRPVSITLTIAGKVVTGTATREGETPSINGTVWEDGTFGATIGFHHFTGRFKSNEFEGSFRSADCTWRVLLRRTK